MNSAGPLRGQLGMIHVFDDVLTPSQVQGIFRMGPNALLTLNAAEYAVVEWARVLVCISNINRDTVPRHGRPLAKLERNPSDSSVEGTLKDKLLLAYCPRASGKAVVFNSAAGADSRTDAALSAETQIFQTHHVKDVIGCVGGVEVLFPYLLQAEVQEDMDGGGNVVVDPLVTGRLLFLLVAMVGGLLSLHCLLSMGPRANVFVFYDSSCAITFRTRTVCRDAAGSMSSAFFSNG